MFLIAELSLGILFGMSLISAQLWVIIDLPPYILAIILVQALVTAAVTIAFVFRIMGRDHDAAVMCSGFAGLALGSASTATGWEPRPNQLARIACNVPGLRCDSYPASISCWLYM